MNTVIRSGRFYFWPIIASNTLTMTYFVGGELKTAAAFSLVISMLASFGFLINDLWDRDVDRVNQARHFENSNKSTRMIATSASLFLLTAGLGLALILGTEEFYTALVIASALVAYTILLRKLLLIPTIVAAILATSPLWSPLILWARSRNVWTELFLVALILMVAARETFMDARDRLGDIAGGRNTMATVFGTRIAKLVATMVTVSASIPFFIGVLHNIGTAPIWWRPIATVIAVAILYLLIRPAFRTLRESENERVPIQKYVLSSRVAMALIPILILCWGN